MVIRFGVVILAAGASQRMGRPKLLLPWGDRSVLEHLVAQWERLGIEQVGVVRSRGNLALVDALERLGGPRLLRIENPDPSRGMFSSIQCAASDSRWVRGITHWALSLGDQPHLRDHTLAGLLQFSRENPEFICQPSRAGRPRHPVAFPRSSFEALRYSEDAHLRAFLERRGSERRLMPSDDPGLDLDMDTPADYEAAKRLAFGGPPSSSECGD